VTKTLLAGIALLAAALGLTTLAKASDDATTAAATTQQWTLNLDKSDYSKMPLLKPKSVLLSVNQQGDKLSWTYAGQAQDGKSFKWTFDGAIDGKPYPVNGSEPPLTMTYNRDENGQLNSTWTDGHHTSTGAISVSGDGKVLTINNSTKDEDGNVVTWIEVYDLK
jgi:hypothetical protein